MAKENKVTIQESPKAVRLGDATRLTVIITEDSTGAMDIQIEAFSIDQNKKIVMRPSHVVGQLYTAAMFLTTDHYTTLKEQLIAK